MDDPETATSPHRHTADVPRAADAPSGPEDVASGEGNVAPSDPETEAARWAAVAASARGRERADALCRQAEILERALERPAEATAVRRRALLWDPGHPEASTALLERAEADDDALRCVLLDTRRFATERDPRLRAAIALAQARRERDRLHNPASARAWLERGVEACPDDDGLRHALVDHLRERHETDALLTQLEARVRIGEDATPAAVRIEAASLRDARGDGALALAHLQQAATAAPEDAAVLDALIATFAKLGRHGDLADALERRVTLTADDDERVALLSRLGAHHETRLYDPDAALEAFERAHALAPDEPGLVEPLERLRAKREAEDAPEIDGSAAEAALAAYEREAEITHDRERLGVLVREIERLHTRLGSPECALPWVKRWAAVAPEEPEALRALARQYEAPGEEVALTATLETLDRLLPPTDQLANRRRLAKLYATIRRRPDAARAYGRILELEPGNLDALEGRAAMLRELGDTAGLASALGQLAMRRPTGERLGVRLELADLHERSGDLSRAVAVLECAEQEDDASLEATERLDDLLARMLRHEELAERLAQRAATHDPGAAEAVALELRRASLLLEGLQRCDEAAEVYRRVLEHAPASREARTGLERALRSSVDAAGLAEFLEDQELRTEDPAERDRLTLERAVLLDDLLDRRDDALALLLPLARKSDVTAVKREASERAEELLERLSRWSALREHLERQLRDGVQDEEVRIHEVLARLCAERLDDPSGELEHLERVVTLDPARIDVWQTLASRYELDGRDEDHARALEAELASHPDHARELDLRGGLAGLYEDALARPELARGHYERVFELSPLHNGATEYLIAAYEREERFEDVVRLLEARLAAIDAAADDDPHAPNRRTALRLQIAHLRGTRLDDPEGAISALEVALDEVGPDAVIAEPLAAAYQRGGYGSDLIDLCERAASASQERDERANWLIRLGDTHLERDEVRDAADAYRRALTERPGDRAVEASLRELHRQLDEREPLCALLEAELRHLAGTSEIPVRLELLELLADARPGDALLHARRVLELTPHHARAFEHAMRLAESLGDAEQALSLVDARRACARTPGESADLALRRARLLAGALSRPDDAIAAYRDAIERTPVSAEEILPELAQLLEAENRTGDWLECWERMLWTAPAEERAARIERASVVAWEQRSPAAALPWLERLRLERPGDRDVLSRITRAHREAGDEAALVRSLADEADASDDPAHRRRCHLERASLLRASGAPGRALAALVLAGPDLEVLAQCEEIERELGLHARRAKTLEAILATGGPDLEKLRELARLHRDELGAPGAALRCWQSARELVTRGSGADIEILRAMAETARDGGRTDVWARHAETELSVLAPDPVFDDRRRELRSELALAYDERLARPGLALGHLRALLDAGHTELLGSELRDRLERACLRLLRAEGDVVELERRLTTRLERVGGDSRDWLELAAIREERLRHIAAAQDAYRRAGEVDPRSLEALRGLRRTAELLGRWSDVCAALERELEIDADRDATARGALLRALGDIYWHRISSTTRASRCYAAALEANSTDFAALRALERLLEAMEDWRGALDLYESEIEVLGDANPRRRREIWLRVAELARDRDADPERARQAMRQAAKIQALGAGHLFELASLHDAVEDHEAFAETFATWCDAPDAGASAEDHLRLALAIESLGRRDEALARAERAAAGDDAGAAIFDALARLRAEAGDPAASALALAQAAERVEDPAAAERLFEAAERVREDDPSAALAFLRKAAARCPMEGRVQARRAELAALRGEDAEAEEAAVAALGSHTALALAERVGAARTGAEAALRRGRLEAASGLFSEALRLAPDDLGSLGGHAETLVALGDHGGARPILEQRLEDAVAYPERAFHRALLGVCVERAGDPEEALLHFEAALDDDPRQPEALEAYARGLESLDRVDPGIRILERLASVAPDGVTCAGCLLRAARWELRRGGREASAERHLRHAVAADPSLAPAWLALANLQLDADRAEDVIETTDRAACHLADASDLATAAHLQGVALEQRGDRGEAATLYGIAAETDPSRVDSALVRARLLRGFGEWREAATALATFAERAPEESEGLAEVHEQLGRLRAGPLEDLDGAVLSYRRAIDLAPDRLEARAALAGLLSHRPGDWDEALAHLRVVLDERPAHANCLRVALRIARGREDAAHAATGVAIQHALGVASAYETAPESSDAAPYVTEPPAMTEARCEQLRLLAVESASELDTVLGGGAATPGRDTDDEVMAFRSRVLAMQGELAAPSLLTRSGADVGEVLMLVVELVLEPNHVSGDGNLVNGLSEALGRRRRRKLRRILGEGARPEDFGDVDWAHWQTEMRALAAAEILRQDGADADLRTALVALTADAADGSDVREATDLALRIDSDPTARRLLARVVADWLGRL